MTSLNQLSCYSYDYKKQNSYRKNDIVLCNANLKCLLFRTRLLPVNCSRVSDESNWVAN